MPELLGYQFDRTYAGAIERYRKVSTIAERDAIPTGKRWEGMLCYVTGEQKDYQLRGGVANLDWTEVAIGGGTLFDTGINDSDDITEGIVNLFMDSTEQSKLGFITITQAVDLDQLEADVAALGSGVTFIDEWDASSGSFPGGGTAQIGDLYVVTTGGTVDSVSFSIGDGVIAKVNNASTTTFAGNWIKTTGTAEVSSVAGLTGVISASSLLTALNVESGATADQTGAEIVTAIDTELGSANWQTQLTTENVMDIVGAGIGTQTRITVTYDDPSGLINYVVDSFLVVYTNLTTLIAGQGTQSDDVVYEVTDGSGFTNVTSGRCWVRYKGTTAGDETDYIIISKEESVAQTAPIHLTYADLSALIAGQGNQINKFIYEVTDGSGFTGITSGVVWAKYLGTTLGTEADYIIVSAEQWASGGGATQLSDLTDVNTSTPTNRNVLVADGVDFESRALVEADISDLQSYLLNINSETLSDLSDIPAEPTGGAVEYYLKYNDTGDVFTWEDITTLGGGNVSNTGTPVDNQIAVFTNATTIEGDTAFTFDTSQNLLAVGIPDVQAGFLRLGSSSTIAGGKIEMYSPADADLGVDYYLIEVTSVGDFRLAAQGVNFFYYDESTEKIIIGKYGSGARTGTATYMLAVDASGNIIEEALPSGGGDVTKVGTPVDNQIGVWTGDGTIEGDTGFTFVNTTNTLSVGVNDTEAGTINVYGESNNTGSQINLYAGATADTNNEFWRLGLSVGAFEIQDAAGNSAIRIDDFNLTVAFEDGTINVGVTDSVRGSVNIFGDSGSNGGSLRIYNAALEDTNDDYYQLVGSATESFQLLGATSGVIFEFHSTTGNIDINPSGTGNVTIGNYVFDGDQTVGAGQDNYVLTYDNGTGLISLEAATGGGGSIGGSITDNQIAVGAATANDIEGSANFTYDGTNVTVTGGDVRAADFQLLGTNQGITFFDGGTITAGTTAIQINAPTGDEVQLQVNATNIASFLSSRASIDVGLLTVGSTDSNNGVMYLYGDGAASTAGGEIQIYTAADHDTTINFYGIKAFEDDLVIELSAGTDIFKYDGGLNKWIVGSGTAFEADGFQTPTGTSTQFLKADGSVDGSTYLTGITGETLSNLSDIPAEPTGGSADYFLQYADTGDTFSWVDVSTLGSSPAGANTQIQYNSSGSFGASAAFTFDGTKTVSVGENDSVNGVIQVYGDSANSGGNISLFTGALSDTTINQYQLQANNDDFELKAGAATKLVYDGTNSNWRIDDYGSGTVTGTAAYSLAVDSAGNIIEEALVTKPTLSKSISIADIQATDDVTMFYTPVAITVAAVHSHITGGTNVVFNIGHAATRTGTQLDVFTSDITLTSTAGQTNNTGFNDATIPANSWVWLETVSVSGTVTLFHVTLEYTED